MKHGFAASISFLKRRIRSVRGLSTVPGLIALALWALSLFTLWVDGAFPSFADSKAFRLFYTDYDTAKSVLSTVAAASITTLGLVYSIVLVVFTTAAGNIGPRLLQRFTGDRVNQFTAGLFGGTFLFSLTILHQTDSSFVPSFSIAVTFVLAGLSVLQLIYFVHSASVSVTVDEEVAEISARLENDIQSLIHDEDMDRYESDIPERNESGTLIRSDKSGYISFLNVSKLVAIAQKEDTFFSLLHGQGEFVVAGQKLVQINSKLSHSNLDELETNILKTISVSSSRSPDSDVEFAINLLIEIALRALSPGINDTYTAVTCIDRLSSALASPVKNGLRDHVRADDDGLPRLHVPGLTVEDLINTAFHPLRRASQSNLLMNKHILNALGRLYEVGDDDSRKVLALHADLLVQGAKKSGLLAADFKFIEDRRKENFGNSDGKT